MVGKAALRAEAQESRCLRSGGGDGLGGACFVAAEEDEDDACGVGGEGGPIYSGFNGRPAGEGSSSQMGEVKSALDAVSY